MRRVTGVFVNGSRMLTNAQNVLNSLVSPSCVNLLLGFDSEGEEATKEGKLVFFTITQRSEQIEGNYCWFEPFLIVHFNGV